MVGILKNMLAESREALCNYELLQNYKEWKEGAKVVLVPADRLQGTCLRDMPLSVMTDCEEELLHIVERSHHENLDLPMIRAMNEAFLNILRSRYWMEIEAGEMVPGTNEAEVLITSTKLAVREASQGLADFKFVQPYCTRSNLPPALQRMSFARSSSSSETDDPNDAAADGPLLTWDAMPYGSIFSKEAMARIVNSSQFGFVMCFTIVLNAILIVVEELQEDDSDKVTASWLIVDMIFTVAFTVELMMKLQALRWRYFWKGWNLFDCFLVILGWAGTIFNIISLETSTGSDGNLSRKGVLFRFARVFRLLRVLRLFRLVVLFQVLRAKMLGRMLSVTIAEHMQKVTILKCFIRCHLLTQVELLRYFGLNNKPDSFELARCIMQSQTAVYQAATIALEEEQQLGGPLALSVNNVKNTEAVAEHLEKFIEEAYAQGVVSTHEAESLLVPIREHMKIWQSRLRNNHFGRISRNLMATGDRAASKETTVTNDTHVSVPSSPVSSSACPTTPSACPSLPSPTKESFSQSSSTEFQHHTSAQSSIASMRTASARTPKGSLVQQKAGSAHVAWHSEEMHQIREEPKGEDGGKEQDSSNTMAKRRPPPLSTVEQEEVCVFRYESEEHLADGGAAH
jgi:hypothetical protein